MYVFDGAAGTVLVMATNTSLAGAARTAGFHPEARYEFKVHLDGAQAEGVTFRFTFGAADAGGAQPMTVERLGDSDAADDSATGTVVAEGTTGAPVDGSRGLRAWAGTAADPFYLDLKELSFIIGGVQSKQPIVFDGWQLGDAASSFTGSHVEAIVLEVPTSDRDLSDGRDIGVWSVTKLATDDGGWRQINRAAIPMMWPLFRAIGDSDDSERYAIDTTARPADDVANDGDRITGMIAAAAGATGTRNPEAYARLVTDRLLPDVLPYRVGTPACFGFAGFNGRALDDNAPEVMYSLVTNTAFQSGLTAAAAAQTRGDGFPYVLPAGASA